jgi:ABC-type bacteriocin/lantibiotic exporter with double-glycine peptidase domain
MIKILTSLLVVASAIIVFFIPFLKRKNQVLEIKNETLQEENKSNNSLIKSVKNAEEIKAKNSKLSKSDLISGL